MYARSIMRDMTMSSSSGISDILFTILFIALSRSVVIGVTV